MKSWMAPLVAAVVTVVAAIPIYLSAQLSLLLAAIMAIGPLIMASRWPARLRVIHAIEISIFAVVYSFTVWLFIAGPVTSP